MSGNLYYRVTLRCKPYVRRYLCRKYGCPVKGHPYLCDVRKDKELAAVLHRCYKEPGHHEDCKAKNFNGSNYVFVELKLSADIFEREGWELTFTDQLHLNSLLEARCKSNLHSFLTMYFLLGESITYAIKQFYRECGFSEESWPSESIRRSWSRYKAKADLISLKDEFYGVFSKIVMAKMS